MPKHVIVWTEGDGDDSIEVYHEEPTVVVIANREDAGLLAEIEEVKKPGIYILIDGNKRYVGQASGKIIDRIKEHLKTKPWWSQVIFFAREDSRLDKSQLDFLEARLIEKFKVAGFEVENVLPGNTSHIEFFQKSRALGSLSTAMTVLSKTAKVDILKKTRVQSKSKKSKSAVQDGVYSTHIPRHYNTQSKSASSRHGKFEITDTKGRTVKAESRKKAYSDYWTLVMKDEIPRSIIMNLTDISPSFFTKDERYVTTRRDWFNEVYEGFYLYTNLSASYIEKNLQRLGKHINVSIQIQEIDLTS